MEEIYVKAQHMGFGESCLWGECESALQAFSVQYSSGCRRQSLYSLMAVVLIFHLFHLGSIRFCIQTARCGQIFKQYSITGFDCI